jgi:hypothetical protein
MMALEVISVVVGALGTVIVVASIFMAVVGLCTALTGGTIDHCERCGHYYVHDRDSVHDCQSASGLFAVRVHHPHLPRFRHH